MTGRGTARNMMKLRTEESPSNTSREEQLRELKLERERYKNMIEYAFTRLPQQGHIKRPRLIEQYVGLAQF